MKLTKTATATRNPNLLKGGTELVIKTPNPNANASKLKSKARPADL